ncbi:MAG: hypothetical protein HRF47_09445 [Chloroflexota bacterium]|jgi:hypothetical protein
MSCDHCGKPIDDLHLLRTSDGRREWVCSSCWRDAHRQQDYKEIRQEQKQWTTPARP